MDDGISATGTNFGSIFIDTCSTGFNVAGGDYINKSGGMLSVAECNVGIDLSLRDFYNNQGGQVLLNKNELGVLIPSAGVFTNEGLMRIDSSITNGIHCYGKLYNQLSAQLKIDRGLENGIFLDAATANIYCRDQSILEILRYNGNEILIDKGNLWIEDNATFKVKSN